jgi:hypothetical protein
MSAQKNNNSNANVSELVDEHQVNSSGVSSGAYWDAQHRRLLGVGVAASIDGREVLDKFVKTGSDVREGME